MDLLWTPEAIQDRGDIYDYVEAGNSAAALALDELFAEKAGRLIDHPGLGRPGRVTSTRELVAHQNYILIYDMADDSVRVLRVLHAARQWPPFQEHDKIKTITASATAPRGKNVATRLAKLTVAAMPWLSKDTDLTPPDGGPETAGPAAYPPTQRG